MRSGRHISAILLAAAALLMTLGCVKEPVKVPIAVTPSVEKTKALVLDADGLKNQEISLLGTALNGGSTLAPFENTRLYYDNSNTSWSYEPIRYWIPQSLYTFGAFSPYTADGSESKLSNGSVSYSAVSGTPTLTISDYNTGKGDTFDARSEDLLFNSYTRDNTAANDYTAVPLEMSHLMANLFFRLRNTTNTDITSLSNIYLRGLKYKCDITIDPSVAILTPKEDIVEESDSFFTSETRTGTPFLPKGMAETEYKPLFDCENLTVLPQDVHGKNIILLFTANFAGGESTPYSINLSEIESLTRWQEGKNYIYNFTISSKDIIFQVVEVPWIEHKVEL